MSCISENQAQRVIGGVFALHEAQPTDPSTGKRPFLEPNVMFLANARGAFCYLGRTLRPRRVWLPSYLCSSIAEGFQAAGSEIAVYPLGENLRCESDAWVQQVESGDFVLRVHYFGFANADPLYYEAVKRGACLVDDAAQALLSQGIGTDADFVVYSPRKFVGVPDGGCLVSRSLLPEPSKQFATAPEAWWNESLSAVTLRRDFDRGGRDRDWFAKFQSAESQAPALPYAMSDLSKRLLTGGIDFDAISARRRSNYQLLLEFLGDVALFPELPEGVVPLGFPVHVRKRDVIRKKLFEHGIYPPVHWPLQSFVPPTFESSHRLAARIMTLPFDQRYSAYDMKRMVTVLQRFMTCY